MEGYSSPELPPEQPDVPDDFPEWIKQLANTPQQPGEPDTIAEWQQRVAKMWESNQIAPPDSETRDGVSLGIVGARWEGRPDRKYWNRSTIFLAGLAAQEALEHPEDQEAQERLAVWRGEVRRIEPLEGI